MNQPYLNFENWRSPTKEEMLDIIKGISGSLKDPTFKLKKMSILAVRQQLSPVDVYCYLKCRFGEPNGFQTFIKSDNSENLIHWDYNIKVEDSDIYVCGTSRETHFWLPAPVSDKSWRTFLARLKEDFRRVAKEKTATRKDLEEWVIFPNKYVALSHICAELHGDISDNIGGYIEYTPKKISVKNARAQRRALKNLSERAKILYRSCLELSLITPILAESFINMVIVLLCKDEVRQNQRQLESFIRSNIDMKVFDLPLKCVGFKDNINPGAPEYKNFKRIMDKRNQSIHGNVDPIKDKIETVFFDRKTPLFTEPGDHIGRFYESLENQLQPKVVIQDYENVHSFFSYLVSCLHEDGRFAFWAFMENPYPGFDINRRISGVLFSDTLYAGYFPGVRYDDELKA